MSTAPRLRVLLLAQAAFMVGFSSVVPFIAVLADARFGLGPAAIGAIVGARVAVQQGLFLVGGALADRFGPRALLLSGCAVRAAGFVLLAFAPRAILDITLQRVTRYTESTPIAPERLQQLVAETRRTGFVVSHGEYQEGAVAVAVPVFVDSELACSLTVAGPRERCDAEEWTRRAVRLLRAQAKELALKLAD